MLNKNANVIYVDSDQKHVGAVLVYYRVEEDGTHLACYDKECTKLITGEELFDLCMKKLVVVPYVYSDITYYELPTSFGWGFDGMMMVEVKDVNIQAASAETTE